MKYFASAALAFAAAVAAATSTTKCNADNCARAVTGTLRAQTASHFADCQSFLACTVTPAPSAVIVTTTVTVTAAPTGSPNSPDKRQQQPAASSGVTRCPSAVPTYASACSGTVRYSSACSCFGASKSTTTLPATTTTSTSTATVTVTPTPACDTVNKGFQWAYYTSPDDGSNAINYDPAVVKTETPTAQGVTDYIAIAQDQGVYGQDLDQENFILNHRGYIFAPETGTYALSGVNIDDITHMWIGPLAYAGWDRDNAQQILQSGNNNGSGTFLIDLVAGNYYPFRLVYRQIGGALSLSYSITAPSGLTIIAGDPEGASFSPYAVQYSCDSPASAPPFPAFGQES